MIYFGIIRLRNTDSHITFHLNTDSGQQALLQASRLAGNGIMYEENALELYRGVPVDLENPDRDTRPPSREDLREFQAAALSLQREQNDRLQRIGDLIEKLISRQDTI